MYCVHVLHSFYLYSGPLLYAKARPTFSRLKAA
jgi:hypothetical protein